MATKDHYLSYVSDDKMIGSYKDYQKKYRVEPRESDKVAIDLVAGVTAEKQDISILDVACSTGNFLYHLRNRFPLAHLTGADLAVGFIENCERDAELAGINFIIADLLNLRDIGRFDVITANAVTYLFDWPEYRTALKSIADALNPGGVYVGFEFVNPFSVQDLTIVETSDWNPDGLTLRIRPMKKVEQAIKESGFESVAFHPFKLPIDLKHPGFDADVMTYTVRDEFGERMAFRGSLYQPWCHIVAYKS
jgi:SAM-dependent methyltransferase